MLRNLSGGTVGGYLATTYLHIIGGTWDSTAGVGAPSGNCTVMAFGHCGQVLVESTVIVNENQWHHIEFNGSEYCTVRDCVFTGGYDTAYMGNEAIQIDSTDTPGQFPWFGPYDGTGCRYVLVTGRKQLRRHDLELKIALAGNGWCRSGGEDFTATASEVPAESRNVDTRPGFPEIQADGFSIRLVLAFACHLLLEHIAEQELHVPLALAVGLVGEEVGAIDGRTPAPV